MKGKPQLRQVWDELSKINLSLLALVSGFLIEAVAFPGFYFLQAADATGFVGAFGKFYICFHWPALKFTQSICSWAHFANSAPVAMIFFTSCFVETFLVLFAGIWLLRQMQKESSDV